MGLTVLCESRPLVALQPELVQFIPFPARSGFGMSALAALIGEFQGPKVPKGLPKGLALRVDVNLDGRRFLLKLATARDSRYGVARKMNALTVPPLGMVILEWTGEADE